MLRNDPLVAGRRLYDNRSTYNTLLLRLEMTTRNGADVPCMRRDSNPEWWHIEEKKIEDRAKALCAICPVQPDCLRHAIRYDETGVWGGMNRNERRKAAAA